MFDANPIIEALLAKNLDQLADQVRVTRDQGVPARDILNLALIPAMDIVGERMETGEMYIPEVLVSAKAMSMAVEILKPQLGEEGVTVAGKVVIGTVKGDLHDIGKNLVAMMLESAGFEIHNLGVDVAPSAFVEAVKEVKPDILALSALLTTTMPMMQRTIETLTESGQRGNMRIIVGGAPVTEKFAGEIGADGYAPDAGAANKLAKKLIE
jgi:5-methyltetrahydrofolate--homocysteine methyltransferase